MAPLFGMAFWSILVVVCAASTLVMAILAVRRRSMRAFWWALLLLVLTACSTAGAVWHLLTRAKHRLERWFAPRSAELIYASMFGGPAHDCLSIQDHQDRIIPRIDTTIRLRVKTCPAELARILEQGRYTRTLTTSDHPALPSSDGPAAFAPAQLGDTLVLYHQEVLPGRNWRWIQANCDSTLAIIVDVMD
ncbi:MAG: hypothetical protein ACO1NQ_00850 [Flavobacteriales bacterium]